jgi:hypothetical protein
VKTDGRWSSSCQDANSAPLASDAMTLALIGFAPLTDLLLAVSPEPVYAQVTQPGSSQGLGKESCHERRPECAVREGLLQAKLPLSDELAYHHYVMVLHDHQENPHVHLSVQAESRHGTRLNPRKADLAGSLCREVGGTSPQHRRGQPVHEQHVHRAT